MKTVLLKDSILFEITVDKEMEREILDKTIVRCKGVSYLSTTDTHIIVGGNPKELYKFLQLLAMETVIILK